MAIHVPLLFHFNENLTEHALTASRAGYKGLLRVLRAHPTIPVNIHISGTLVNALQWMDPEPLQLIWEGLRAGQFELLGSTYAQNIPYSSDAWDNARQIELHLKVLHDVFGVTPVTFWNPQRTWRQDLLPTIASNGYRFTLLEDHVLAKARLAEPVVVTSQVGAHILTLLYDDHLLRHLFNFAVWFGRPRQLQSYLAKRADHPNVNSHCLTYAESANAMGLWGWKKGVVPNQTWHRLDQLLTLMEALPEIELIHLTNAPASAGNLSPIPDGNAMWMDDALENENSPAYEPGFANWFEYNEGSEKLLQYRRFFGDIRANLQDFEARLDNEKKGPRLKAARALLETARETYLSHQYAFGRVGVGYDGYWGWEAARAAVPILRAAEMALKPDTVVENAPLTGSADEEVVLSDGRNFVVASPAGGRILYWFDLTSGRQYIGNQRAVGLGDYDGDAALPDRTTLTVPEKLPDDFRPQTLIPEARLIAEAAPTRMHAHLPEWIWEDERGPFELLAYHDNGGVARRSIPVQRRGLVDYIEVKARAAEDAGAWLSSTVTDRGVRFQRVLAGSIELTKTILLEDGEVVAEYLWRNSGDTSTTVRWCALSELTPDYATILVKGRKALQFVDDLERPAVRNTVSKEEVQLIGTPTPEGVQCREGLLALEIALKYELTIEAGEEQCIRIRMRRASAKQREGVES